METTSDSWNEEKTRVQHVIVKISNQVRRMEKEVGRARLDVVTTRKDFWDEVTLNLGTSDDLVESHFSIRQHAEVLSEQERLYSHSAKKLKSLTRLIESPYFGRIDFREEGSKETERIYIGTASFADENDTFWVYDWRAPISSLYYDFAPGVVQYKAPFGEVRGEMSLKRQYVIRSGELKYMFDTGMTIGDEVLIEVLSRHSDAQMKSIVATIQREQNEIIRNDRSQLLVVQGAAGSGKTSAALQRVAYLLYKYRETLRADQMVLFSPNPLFNSYVATVLPELGEENMQQTTFQSYLDRRLGDDYEVEDPFNQLEYILSAMGEKEYESRLSGISYKSSIHFLSTIHAYRDLLGTEQMLFLPIKFQGREIISAADIGRYFYHLDASLRISHRIELVRNWLLAQVNAFEAEELEQPWVEDALDLLEPEDYQRGYKELRKMQRGADPTFDDFEKEKQVLSRMVVRRHLKPARHFIKSLQFIDVHGLYRQLFANRALFDKIADSKGIPKDWEQVCQQTAARLDSKILSYEDATPFLYLKELLLGLHVNTTVRHIIVDEAQDYSPLQLEFLKSLFPRARMTALGDLNQAIYAHFSAMTEMKSLFNVYKPGQTEVIRLTNSYRSTREIVEFTRGMVKGGDEIHPFQRSGDKPIVTIVGNRADQIQQIVHDIQTFKASGYESIAIICKTAEESGNAYAMLSEFLSLHLVTKDTLKFEKEVVVIPAYLAKGVEFDAVILYDGSVHRYHREQERNLFYTACTRAMHRLNIYSLGEPSPFITAQSTETYNLEAIRV